MYKQTILNYLLDYLKLKKIPLKKSGKIVMLECPFCKKQPLSANIIPNTSIVNCFACHKKYNLLDIAKELEVKFPGTEEEQLQYLKKLLKIDVVTKKDENEIEKVLDFYVEKGFDLVPVAKNGKAPIEKDWTNKSHKDKKEWLEWLHNGLNIGVKTGIKSGITVIDIDQKPIPEEVRELVKNVLIQETKNGYHLFFKYEENLPKTRINDLKIDLENNGGQVVLYPSIVEGIGRKFLNSENITTMSNALKKLLQSKIDFPNLKTNSEKLKEDIETENFKLDLFEEGTRNSSLITLGGIFRKELNIPQTQFVLNVLNNHNNNSLPPKEINAMMKKLEHYSKFDEEELALKVLQYLRDVEEANRTEISMAIANTNRGEEKKRVDKSLFYLVKEGYLLKRGKNYHIIKKAEWKESLIEIGKPIDFKMPYFDDIANFKYQDLLLIGSKNKRGKTHVSINIIKRLVEQGKKPYYVSLETGSRFAQIALQLGLKEGDFYHTFCADPTKIELEPDAITIIDWLLIIDKSKTDLVFRSLIEQLYKTNGLIICFMQLKSSKEQNNQWFAPNMVSQFPSLSARYLYEKDDDGTYGKFVIDEIREPKANIKTFEILCKYDWKSKQLKRIDELKENER